MAKESTTTRKRAVGAEAARIERRILRAITAARDDGMTQMELIKKLDLTEKVARRLLGHLRVEGRKRIYIARWKPNNTHLCPVFVIGSLPDAPKPAQKMLRSNPEPRGASVEALAKQEIAAEHARWAATWVPHCDPAAAWIGRAAA
ncbi:hypothetical protein E5S69_20730 [Cupriavidus necator]|uniref:hypothetical protein n=1 Tax=Cupriavidus necator TaxID=106590 RepID=UPI001490737A|nr:hypothetical protein [Cupriavidus necator]NOV25931.1 hypothetical protein [Cupriavidus necator]